MDMEKLKKWMDAAQAYQTETFWSNIFDTQQKNGASLTPLSISEFIPKCDLYEIENMLVAEVEIPGVTKENLHISLQPQLLTISGEFQSLKQNRKYFLKERANHKFKKEVTLPYPIILQQVKSEIRQGILTILMPIHHDEVENIPISIKNSNP
jgi:HSP20 family protein